MNPLESSGKPLFFKVEDDTGFKVPDNRHGMTVRTAARSLSVMQKEALIASSFTRDAWRVSSDEGAYLDGNDVSPCPLAHMTAGMVASFMDSTLTLAKQRGVELRGIRLIQDNYYTMTGSALRGTMTGGALPVGLTAEVENDLDRDEVELLLRDAITCAPVRGLIGSVLNSRFTLTHNGDEIGLGRVEPIGGSALSISGDMFDAAQPANGDWSGLMSRGGMSPTTDEITSSAGSSYAEDQSRQLHVRGICTVRPDGVKVIEQQLFNPHGSVFYFLSEEGPQAGGQGRAPDAMSYVSAGIAFCFLTQFGRYAKIVKKPLKRYSVVQDTYFSTWDAGQASVAHPVETHVHLETEEGDDFAREALDMSEQTCFLHALCRSEIAVNVQVADASTSAE